MRDEVESVVKKVTQATAEISARSPEAAQQLGGGTDEFLRVEKTVAGLKLEVENLPSPEPEEPKFQHHITVEDDTLNGARLSRPTNLSGRLLELGLTLLGLEPQAEGYLKSRGMSRRTVEVDLPTPMLTGDDQQVFMARVSVSQFVSGPEQERPAWPTRVWVSLLRLFEAGDPDSAFNPSLRTIEKELEVRAPGIPYPQGPLSRKLVGTRSRFQREVGAIEAFIAKFEEIATQLVKEQQALADEAERFSTHLATLGEPTGVPDAIEQQRVEVGKLAERVGETDGEITDLEKRFDTLKQFVEEASKPPSSGSSVPFVAANVMDAVRRLDSQGERHERLFNRLRPAIESLEKRSNRVREQTNEHGKALLSIEPPGSVAASVEQDGRGLAAIANRIEQLRQELDWADRTLRALSSPKAS